MLVELGMTKHFHDVSESTKVRDTPVSTRRLRSTDDVSSLEILAQALFQKESQNPVVIACLILLSHSEPGPVLCRTVAIALPQRNGPVL
jgi:hypothetical protein